MKKQELETAKSTFKQLISAPDQTKVVIRETSELCDSCSKHVNELKVA